MKKILFSLTVLLSAYIQTLASDMSESTKECISKLDSCILVKSTFDRIKNEHIDSLKHLLNNSDDITRQYELNNQLTQEYKSYQFDSASCYSRRSLDIAEKIGDNRYITEAKCNMAFCLISAGLYKEAFDIMKHIDSKKLTRQYMWQYYWVMMRLNNSIADYNHTEPYHQEYMGKGAAYADSLLRITDDETSEWWSISAEQQMKQYMYESSMVSYLKAMSYSDIDWHDKAVASSSVGWMYWRQGDVDKAIRYLAISAISDIMSSTKETTALRALAELLSTTGDTKRANSYIQSSLEDANFYGARLRKIEIGEILPLIESNRYTMLAKHNKVLIIAISVIIILLVILLYAFRKVRNQQKKIIDATNEIDKRNHWLADANSQLQEANRIKAEYIGNSFFFNAVFLDKLQKLSSTIDRKIMARQYDDLRNLVGESMLNNERDNMFAVFDETFLKIFPNYVERYNDLFDESERKNPERENTLTTEMRIFALIRLGLTDSDRIAQFLNKSVNTINTYKTRVKNKSRVENDMFERMIMQIDMVN